METLVKRGELKAFKHYKFWQCMDTLRDKKYLNNIIKSGKIPWKFKNEKFYKIKNFSNRRHWF